MTLPVDAQVTFLPVTDLEASHAFYADGLGFDLVLDQGPCRIYRTAPSSFLGICRKSAVTISGVIVTIVADDVAGWYERCVAAGIPVDGPPRDNPEYRIHQFFATDPDGHTIEFQRFWDAGWSNVPA